MFCKNCGKELNGSPKYCPECGASLNVEAGNSANNYLKRASISLDNREWGTADMFYEMVLDIDPENGDDLYFKTAYFFLSNLLWEKYSRGDFIFRLILLNKRVQLCHYLLLLFRANICIYVDEQITTAFKCNY